MTLQGIRFLRYLFTIPGVSLLVAGALLVSQADYATTPFVAGLTLHLIGLALCLTGLITGRLITWLLRPAPLRSSMRSGTPSSDTSRPRSAHFRLSTQFMRLALGMVLVAAVLTGPAIAVHRLGQLMVLRRTGVVVDAQIINKVPVTELGSARYGTVYYAFSADNTIFTGQFRALRSDYPQMRTGRHLIVTYLPANPQVHLLGRVDASAMKRQVAALLLLLLTGLVYIALPALSIERRLRRQLRLARSGVMITGTITGCKPINRRKNRAGYRVRYEFALPSGVLFSGQARVPHLSGEPTLIGFPITILYDAAWPWYNRPLIAFQQVDFNRVSKGALAV